MRIVRSYHVQRQLGKESNQKWAKKLLNGLITKLVEAAHYLSKENSLMTLFKEVEPLWVYGWWARHEMLKTGKCSPHKERRKGINGMELAEAHW